MSVGIPDEVRAQLRRGLASNPGIPADKIGEIVDLACHAAEAGFETTRRIALDTSPDNRVGITTLGPALGLLQALTDHGLSALGKVAEANGMASVTVTIGDGA